MFAAKIEQNMKKESEVKHKSMPPNNDRRSSRPLPTNTNKNKQKDLIFYSPFPQDILNEKGELTRICLYWL